MMKLYMPLHADLYTKDDWSDTSEEPEMLTGRALMEYEDSILIALIKKPYVGGSRARHHALVWSRGQCRPQG